MASQKRFTLFACTVCKREIELETDPLRGRIDRCTITLGCEGRLKPIEERNTRLFLRPPPVSGVTDWYPRGQKPTSIAALQDPALFSVFTGDASEVTLAVRVTPGPPLVPTTAVVKFIREQATAKQYLQFVYSRTPPFVSISGAEDGAQHKVLSFQAFGPTPDTVLVFVDGVQRNLGPNPNDYQVFDGINSIPPNTVRFNTTITGPSAVQVDVIVFKAATPDNRFLSFTRNIPLAFANSSWGNVDTVQINGETYQLFTSTTVTPFPLNSILRVSQAAGDVEINDGISFKTADAADCFFLLSRQPYSVVDRLKTVAIPLTNTSDETKFLKYFPQNNANVLAATEDCVVDVFPAINSLVEFLVVNVADDIPDEQVPGVEQTLPNDSLILGPKP